MRSILWERRRRRIQSAQDRASERDPRERSEQSDIVRAAPKHSVGAWERLARRPT
jgi:hypothetical protein